MFSVSSRVSEHFCLAFYTDNFKKYQLCDALIVLHCYSKQTASFQMTSTLHTFAIATKPSMLELISVHYRCRRRSRSLREWWEIV